jgi:ParB/RepB/Spo0J family partition protein
VLLTDTFQRLPLDQIKVVRDARQRKKIDVAGLLDSVKARGVYNPIIVTRDKVLVAGERRLEASRQAGLQDIPVRFAEDLDPIELQIVELEENLKREDLGWKDLVQSIVRIHELYNNKATASGADWSQQRTAEAIGVSQGLISLYLRVWEDFQDERVQSAGSVREAYNMLTRRDNRAQGSALEELLGATNEIAAAAAGPAPEESRLIDGTAAQGQGQANPASDGPDMAGRGHGTQTTGMGQVGQAKVVPAAAPDIVCGSFIEWSARYTGPKFNLIHCDFPYGVDLFAGPQARGAEPTEGLYGDSKDTYVKLIEAFCGNLDRFASLSCHVMFWFSEKHRDLTQRMFSELAPSIEWQPFPLIWHKTDNAGIASDPSRTPRHVYETALLGSRGKRQIVKIVGDCYGGPSDRRLHASTKPVPMLKHFFSMLVDSNTELLDPTCGSAASLRAAEACGAKRVFGMDIDQGHVDTAWQALKNERLLAAATSSGAL